ncbi:hypothetical protein LguiB_024735 [Lonicera macranthoides]
MGLSSFPSPAEGGVLPVLVMNTVLSVAILKNMVRSVLHVVGANNNGITNSLNSGEEEEEFENINDSWRARRVSITRFESMCNNDNNKGVSNCCVCLSRFREEEEIPLPKEFKRTKTLFTYTTHLASNIYPAMNLAA